MAPAWADMPGIADRPGIRESTPPDARYRRPPRTGRPDPRLSQEVSAKNFPRTRGHTAAMTSAQGLQTGSGWIWTGAAAFELTRRRSGSIRCRPGTRLQCLGTVPSASEFVHQNPRKIPGHLMGKLITLQEAGDHAEPGNRIYPQGFPQAQEAAGPEREVRAVHPGTHAAGYPAGGRGEVRRGPLDGGAHLPDRQAGRAGCARRVGTWPAWHDSRAGRTGRGQSRAGAAAGDGDRAGRGAAPEPGKITLGLTAGLVPPRVDGNVKAGLLALIDHAAEQGWSLRRSSAALGLDHVRVLRWQARAAAGRLDDAPARPEEAAPAVR